MKSRYAPSTKTLTIQGRGLRDYLFVEEEYRVFLYKNGFFLDCSTLYLNTDYFRFSFRKEK